MHDQGKELTLRGPATNYVCQCDEIDSSGYRVSDFGQKLFTDMSKSELNCMMLPNHVLI